jgi:hypothetical protein
MKLGFSKYGEGKTQVELISALMGNESAKRKFNYTRESLSNELVQADRLVAGWEKDSDKVTLQSLVEGVIKPKLHGYIDKKHLDQEGMLNYVFTLINYTKFDPELTFQKIKGVHNFIHMSLTNNPSVCENIWGLYAALLNFRSGMTDQEGTLSANLYKGDLQTCIGELIDIVAHKYVSINKILKNDSGLEVVGCKSDVKYLFNIKKDKSQLTVPWFDLDGRSAPFDNVSVDIRTCELTEGEKTLFNYAHKKKIKHVDEIKELYENVVTKISAWSENSTLTVFMYLELKVLLDVSSSLKTYLNDFMVMSKNNTGAGKKRSSPPNLKKNLEKDINSLLNNAQNCSKVVASFFPDESFLEPSVFTLNIDEKIQKEIDEPENERYVNIGLSRVV